MSQNATRNAKGKSAKTNASNTKHTQNTEDSLSTTKNTTLTKDPNRIAEALKPTPEQIRLASILAVNNDSLENNRKVEQIREVCPDLNEEQALMMLHEKDYDVNKVIEFVMEGGEVSQNWKTAGTKPLKPKPSPNQTLEENQADVSKTTVTKEEYRFRDRKPRLDRKLKQTNVDSMSNGNNLEKRIEFLDLNEMDENMPRQESRRGAGRGGFGGRGRGRGVGRGSFRGRGARSDRRDPRRTQDDSIDSKTYKKLADNPATNETKANQIGTWSNEQAGKADEFEIEEEWQGDLSKTQIFTASTQKKDISESIQQSDFPIGHFNAEEASQNIKKAVGIGSIVSPRATVSDNCPTTDQNDSKVKQAQIKIPPSAKPLPPPNTKIPKSAVIMPGGSTGNSISLGLQFGVDLEDRLDKTKNLTAQPMAQSNGKISSQSYSKQADSANVQKAQSQSASKSFAAQVQNQQQSQTIAGQLPHQQLQNKENTSQILTVSPTNKLPTNSNQQQSQPMLNQLQQIQTTNQTNQSVVNTNKTTTPNSNPIPPTTPGGTVPPPPGVGLLNPNNLVNPNNPYLIGLPFNQNFPYFDQSQIDANLLQMYNHLANMPPPGVGGPNGQSGPQYPISDTKFARNELATSNAALNSSNPGSVSGQLNQPQQQQPPINLIPNLNNYPFFFPNYPYPNFLMQIPNGSQTTPGAPSQPPQPPFANKPPYSQNFPNNPEDYVNYPAQASSQMKSSNSNLSNVNDMSQSYSKTEKTQPGYHTPTPPNTFSNQLLSQQTQQGQHPNLGNNQSGPQPMGYITSIMGSHAGNMVHPGIQDNLNRSSAANLKQKYNWNH